MPPTATVTRTLAQRRELSRELLRGEHRRRYREQLSARVTNNSIFVQ